VAAAGCTSVPLATLWRLRNFGAEQLFAFEPTQLRAAARVDSRATIKNVTITIDIEPPDASARRSYALPLEQPVRDPRLEPAPADRRWYAFALSSHGLVEYQRIKREYASVAKGSRGIVKISASDDGTIAPELRRRFPLRLDILLDPAEGYFTLISETHVDLSGQQKPIK
jgi:hypothetical protein